jgi:transcriptional regulator with XRE-family HTH domain
MHSFTFIREQRTTKGITPQVLAERAGIDCYYLSRLESDSLQADDPMPTVGLMQRLYSVLEG